jgi:hypothetical protein
MQRKGCNAVCNTVTNARETLAIPSPTPPALPPQPYPPQCRYSPVHHGVQLVTRASAPIVAPSPVTTPDAMMSLTAIEHLDFEPEVPCEHSRHRARHADESAAFLVQVIGFCHLGGGERYALCRSGYALSWRVGVLCPVCRSPFTEPGQEPPLRIVQVLR